MGTTDHIFTLGIEEEFQIIDPETRELRSHIQEILADGKMILKEHVKPEMYQSAVDQMVAETYEGLGELAVNAGATA
jgi:gamma-glutamyl:cysteine ligase YbdK (ATP-grasp superfamily)